MGKGICIFCKSPWNSQTSSPTRYSQLKPHGSFGTGGSSIHDYKTIRRLFGHVLKKKPQNNETLNQAVFPYHWMLTNEHHSP